MKTTVMICLQSVSKICIYMYRPYQNKTGICAFKYLKMVRKGDKFSSSSSRRKIVTYNRATTHTAL